MIYSYVRGLVSFMNVPKFERPLDRQRPVDRQRPAYRFYRLAWAGLDLVYPPCCGGCGAPGWRWCEQCQQNSVQISSPVCEICGQSLAKEGYCGDCQLERPAYQRMRSWAVFEGPLRLALHRLKYEGDISLGEVLSRPMIELLQDLAWEVEMVVPIPMSPGRRKQRGYNQAALLAWPVALGCGLAYQPRTLYKVRETQTQVGLNVLERRQNVHGAFQAAPELVTGRSILVVDDVTTSGATMQSAAEALLLCGARQVYGLTLARAAHPGGGRDQHV